MKNKSKGKKIATMFLQGGLVIGFVGGLFVYTEKQIEPVTVYQFNRDIAPNTQISASDLTKVQVPKKAVTEGISLTSNDIVGKYNSTKVFKSEYVMKANLVKKENIDPFESIDLTKLRKISIPVTYAEGLGGNIKKGDRIDLVYVGKESKNDKDFSYSKTFMKDVLIYATTTAEGFEYKDRTQNVKGDVGDLEGQDIGAGEDTGELAQLTLAVTLDQAEEITARLQTGEIRIVGRFNDSQNYDSSGYIQGDFEKVFSGEGLAENNK
ncbi:Flp pilus assembly protein CpaB [Rossellomorea marisflavi]|uniref:Flp pilus assembly protein CpaB n=1 Tax=Rossellomorea marisflavi TaxID=189381 RepID=UPI003FA0E7E8